MSSRKEEERNEKIIRGLMKLPPNRRCINCNNLGPQYVCTNFWTFVCISCSGIHREFTHRVKSVSMSKFTMQEVEALQNGGNQRAREIFLRGWDMQNQRLPNSSNPDKVREFIKMVYVEKKYAKGMSSEKPPQDMQNYRNFAEENRKASSYHSYSQSPPYDHQYEERRYGKQSSLRTRRTGSDRLDHGGKFPGIISSPNHAMQEDRFANESSGSRFSDFSVSSAGEMFRYETQSPISQKNAGYTSPPLQPLQDMLNEEANAKREVSAIPRSRRTASTGSYGLSNSTVPRSVDSTSLIDFVPQGKPLARTQVVETSKLSSADQSCRHSNAANQDLFDLPSVHSAAKSSPQFEDLFAEINQPLSTASSAKNHVRAPFPVNDGWATFDIPQYAASSTESKNISGVMPPKDEKAVQNFNDFPYATNRSQSQTQPQQQSQAQNALAHNHVSLMNDQWSSPLENTSTSVPANTQIWDAFGDLSQNPSKPSMGCLPSKTTSQSSGDVHPAPTDIGDSYKIWTTEGRSAYSFQRTLDRNPLESVSYSGGVPAAPNTSSVIPLMGGNVLEKKSSNPFDLPYERDFEPGNEFLDMNTLQAALPNPSFPDPYIDNKCQPLYPQNVISQFVSPVPSGGSTYVGEYLPNPQLLNLSSQGNAASVGGNPFA